MTLRSKKSAATEEVAAIESLMSDLEQRLHNLSVHSNNARGEISGATSDVREFVNDALADIMKRMRDRTASVGQSAVDEAARIGNHTLKKITDEFEQRPLTLLAIAAGIGFLAGFSNRR